MLRLIAVVLLALMGPAFAQGVATKGYVGFATGQADVTTTAPTPTIPAREGRGLVNVQNHSTTALYCSGASNISTTNGYRIPGVDGANVTIATVDDIYCISASGTVRISYMELY